MIESKYWKEELQRIAKTVRPISRPKRWSERQHCVVERDLMIGFFMIRRLIELGKVTSTTRDFPMAVYAVPARGQLVTLRNRGALELYDFARERKATITPMRLANQFIHAFTSFVFRDERRN